MGTSAYFVVNTMDAGAVVGLIERLTIGGIAL